MPQGHELASDKRDLTLKTLADFPLVTYVFSLTGESSFKQAFQAEGLDPRVAFTARDADIIKTYVRMGMGVGIIASMAYECQDQEDLRAIDATGLFPRITTWLGFPRDMVLRSYMLDFIHLLAPHLPLGIIREAAKAEAPEDLDELLGDIELPVRGGCPEDSAAAA